MCVPFWIIAVIICVIVLGVVAIGIIAYREVMDRVGRVKNSGL